jgi:glycosyltransferase involved in cell wall biosynthesis
MATHVLMIVENLPVPFDRRVWQEATTLAEAGYAVSVICPKGKQYQADEEILEGISIYRHSLPLEARGAAGFLKEYSAALYHQMRLAIKIWRRKPFKIVHVANPPDLMFMIALPFKLMGAKLIFDHHDLTPELYSQKFNKRGIGRAAMQFTEWCSFKVASAVISTNLSYRQIAIDRGGKNPKDIFVVRSSPKADIMRVVDPDPELRAKAKTILGYVGIMGSQDGIDVLLDILQMLLKDHNRTDFHAVLIGDGPERDTMMARATELGLQDHVTFTGYLSGDNLYRALSAIDIGLCPDPFNEYTRRCTMNKIMEYMAFSKPLVQFDLDEGRYSAQDASLYAGPDDMEGFVTSIIRLMDHPGERKAMGEIGRRRVETDLNWSVEVPSLLAAYDRALGKT